MAENKKRVGTVDFFKFVAAVLIVVYHAGGFYNTESEYICLSGFICVEFFFMVSGYLLTAKASKYNGDNVWNATLSMLKGKLMSIFPYMLLAIVASNILYAINIWSGKAISYNLLFSLADIFPLQMQGFSLFAATGVSWYLSVLFAVSFLIYPLLCKHREAYTKYIAPATAILALGFIAHEQGYLNDPGLWMPNAYTFKGVLRGYADIALGCTAFEIKRYWDREGRGWRFLPGVLEIVGYAALILYSVFHGVSDAHDFFMIPLILFAVSVSFSNKSVLAHVFKGSIFNKLGVFSLSIYLNHYFVRENVARLFPELDRVQLLLPYLGIVAALAIVNYVLGRLLSRVLRTGKAVLAATLALVFVSMALSLIPDPAPKWLNGKGTPESPYLVQSLSDLELLRDRVNEGRSLEGEYVLQTVDIDMEDQNWTPIGIFGSDHYFAGTYNGGAHCLYNLRIEGDRGSDSGNIGLFGVLEGTVENLGIESGYLDGHCVGAIASHTEGENACILNCYNKANIYGDARVGGICDNFNEGTVVNCVNEGEVDGYSAWPILSYNADYVAAVDPAGELPSTFKGEYVDISLGEGSVRQKLNNGLSQVLERGILSEFDVIYWNVE